MKKSHKKSPQMSSHIANFAIPREVGRIGSAWLREGMLGFPKRLGHALLTSSALDGPLKESRFFDLLGENAMAIFDALGPVYGKAGQTILSRLSPPLHDMAETLRLTRLYKDWPPLSFAEVSLILDREIPQWRLELSLEAHPLGVASLAQVHAATDRQGRGWVVKILKPGAKKRLLESVEALEQLIALLEPLAVTLTAKRGLKELGELCEGFRRELSLRRERQTIERVKEKLASKRQKLLVIPEVHPLFGTDEVLVVERFVGTSLAQIVSGKVTLTATQRAKLARGMLQELLVQVFELGLFHADPHAGNLILMPSGAVGLFDWGLSGELLESDRRHIAAILRAVMALDFDQLVAALIEMGEEGGRQLTYEQVAKELKAVIVLMQRSQPREDEENAKKKPDFRELFEGCLKGADRLGIAVPEGLLLMAKSLMTIEGLAKGIDPQVSLVRVAAPVLFKAADPKLKDLLAMGRRLPKLAKQFFGR